MGAWNVPPVNAAGKGGSQEWSPMEMTPVQREGQIGDLAPIVHARMFTN